VLGREIMVVCSSALVCANVPFGSRFTSILVSSALSMLSRRICSVPTLIGPHSQKNMWWTFLSGEPFCFSTRSVPVILCQCL
jgi:hypothetical protein